MIRAIAAIDEKKGLATDKGIPWVLPSDKKYFRHKITGGEILMGHGVYQELSRPFTSGRYFVLAHLNEPIKQGFSLVKNLDQFLEDNKSKDLWIIGGANIYAQTLDNTDELYLTRITGDFHCTKFFPNFENKFVLTKKSPVRTENNISFCFEVWRAKN